jgi:hypothetical protein
MIMKRKLAVSENCIIILNIFYCQSIIVITCIGKLLSLLLLHSCIHLYSVCFLADDAVCTKLEIGGHKLVSDNLNQLV